MRGFIAKVNHRKDLLSYLKDTDYVLYEKTIKELNIRKQFNKVIWDFNNSHFLLIFF